MGLPLKSETSLETVTCYKCGVLFAAPTYFMIKRREDTGIFWCPNGHNQAFVESETHRLRQQLDNQIRTATEMAERARVAEQARQKSDAQLKRLNKRVAAGVCPCCNRTFSNLARHMKTKHAEKRKP